MDSQAELSVIKAVQSILVQLGALLELAKNHDDDEDFMRTHGADVEKIASDLDVLLPIWAPMAQSVGVPPETCDLVISQVSEIKSLLIPIDGTGH